MLKNTSFPFECYDQFDRVLGVKSHRWKPYEITNRYKRAILIIRNPYENLLAYFHYRFGGKHLGYTNNKLFTNGGKYTVQSISYRSSIPVSFSLFSFYQEHFRNLTDFVHKICIYQVMQKTDFRPASNFLSPRFFLKSGIDLPDFAIHLVI